MKKQSWKIIVAAAFLTVAGICYGLMRAADGGLETALPPADSVRENLAAVESETAAGDYGPAYTAKLGPAGETGVSGAGAAEGAGLDTSSAETEATIFVHICGAVKKPGVYELPEHSRVFEAVEAAEGFLESAAGESLNLAEKLQDGMKITVLDKDEWKAFTEARHALNGAEPGGVLTFGNAGMEGGGEAAGSVKVNINTAGREELMTLKGIGESRAEDIIAYREQHGPFQSAEELMKVSGIKEAMFQKIKDDITI